jgi:hydroxylamine dehydrogenase
MRRPLMILALALVVCAVPLLSAANESCVQCHRGISPGQVQDWESSRHSKMGISCDTCHGDAHTSADDVNLVTLPDEHVCAGCHVELFVQFAAGKHNF